MTAPSGCRGEMVTEEVTMAYAPGAVERAMKVQEVILRAFSGQLTWLQGPESPQHPPIALSLRALRL